MEKSRIGIIIGQNCPEAVCPIESRKGLLGSPMAVHYTLGWTLCGKVGNGRDTTNQCFFVHTFNEWNNWLQKFWHLDDVSI
jgi:hypothetical protein